MIKNLLYTLFIVLGILSLSGCIATSGARLHTAPPEERVVISPDQTIIDMDTMPDHITFVLAAIVNKMRGDREDIPEVVFQETGEHLFYDPEFTFEEFNLSLIQITGFETIMMDQDQAQLIIEGMFGFRDLFGRGAAVFFAADYTVNQDVILITRSGTALIAPAIPKIETFFVPKSSFAGINMKSMTTFMDFYYHALLNAFQAEPSQNERDAKAEYDQMSFWQKMTYSPKTIPEDYFIMVFCKDRLPHEVSLEMKVTSSPSPTAREIFETGYIYDNGWRMLIAGGEFRPDSYQSNIYMHILYNTDPELNKDPILLGTYKNQKNYNNIPKYIIDRSSRQDTVRTVAQPVVHTPTEGPLASGEILLNPADRDDARIIQTRLAELGFYNMAIDGLWGPGSRGALEGFQRSKHIPANGEWNVQSQMRLFSGTGK